ncbi:MAG: hypothetical protein EBZ64_10700 [Betaproteobacteria bacterium]|nr:hypothetical protein [Betaproteobacteria bacterium]NBP40618.1 hypothetical protein [Betaproteobacteria bacterium]NBQ10190.1 hypothetical protein [Betaproteobacteria bacterium]NBQ80218.1 hypothetical protein [Betaproteobacteria bacterium]NBS22289.1 hypothetical protein [Betaproteobacteria bacterium]
MEWYHRFGFEVDWMHSYEPGFPCFISISTEAWVRVFLAEHHGDGEPRGSDFLVATDIQGLETRMP